MWCWASHSASVFLANNVFGGLFLQLSKTNILGEDRETQAASPQAIDGRNQLTRASPQSGEKSRSGGGGESLSTDEQSWTPHEDRKLAGHAEKAINEGIKQHGQDVFTGLLSASSRVVHWFKGRREFGR